MEKLNTLFFLTMITVHSTRSFIDLDHLKKQVLQWKDFNFHNMTEAAALGNGIFDLSDLKNKFLQWKQQKLTSFCPRNAAQLQRLLNIVCSTAQPTNTTARDSCITCFSRVTSIPEGPQELTGLSVCAQQYFENTSYATCARSLAALASSALNVLTAGCYMGYCDFVRCLRRVNSVNLITQCTREARTGINLTIDEDNVRFYENVTSCILAKARCSTSNPITGDTQVPGYTLSGIRVSNALQMSSAGDLRIVAFPAITPVATSFCSTTTNLTQTSWLTNTC